jgi:hypothetical protein
MISILHKQLGFENRLQTYINLSIFTRGQRGRRGRDHMVVVFTTTYAISAYHVMSWNLDQGKVYNIM